MRLRRRTQNVLMAIVLTLVALSSYISGWPIAQRMEEYLAFVSASDLTHSQLVAQSPVFAVWRQGTDVKLQESGSY